MVYTDLTVHSINGYNTYVEKNVNPSFRLSTSWHGIVLALISQIFLYTIAPPSTRIGCDPKISSDPSIYRSSCSCVAIRGGQVFDVIYAPRSLSSPTSHTFSTFLNHVIIPDRFLIIWPGYTTFTIRAFWAAAVFPLVLDVKPSISFVFHPMYPSPLRHI